MTDRERKNIINKNIEQETKGVRTNSQADIHDSCYEVGNYTYLCDCATCIHRDECSGNDKEED